MLNYHQIKERERVVREMLDDGMIVADIARKLELTPQSVANFLKVRGWKPKVKGDGGRVFNVEEQDQRDSERAERAERRKKINTSVDRSGAGRHKD